MSRKRTTRLVWGIILSLLLFISLLAFLLALWYKSVNGDTGFDSVVFMLISGWDGARSDFILDAVFKALLPSLLIAGAVSVFLFKCKKILLPPMRTLFASLISFGLSLVFLTLAVTEFGIHTYVYSSFKKTPFFENYYVAPTSENVIFPEEKRNLIYIYLESMETTFLDKENGGAFDTNVISELYDLARDNVNFSHNSGVGGALTTTGSTWTIAAMVSHTSGVPLKMPAGAVENVYGTKEPFLPGLTTMQNILADNGYYQALMVGSDGNFGGRREYYKQHGANDVFDLYWALDEGRIDKKNDWWGFDDKTLIEYAKETLSEISEREEPFAFTMLTVDTHHVGGWKCELCGDEYEENYQNVFACSSKQVYELVKWIQEQDFYENTTVIISGDHQSMDQKFMERNVPQNYDRRIYNCFINSACEVDAENTKNREFTTLDMFPTTLAAMGCTIVGDRLGLGTNLFSESQTLAERMGFERFNREISNFSEFYEEKFLGIKNDDETTDEKNQST